MPDYHAMYTQLAGKVSDAVELLIEALQQGEEQYIADDHSQPLLAYLHDIRQGEAPDKG